MLRLEGVTAAYGPVVALDDVSLEVAGGEIAAVLGANGAGKTTLLRAISGLVRPRSGRILLDGEPLGSRPVEGIARLGVAHVPEGRGVIDELTVEENLRLGGLYKRARDTRRVYELFPALGERRARPAATLSGGERQMLALGRALMAGPRLLLLDEPSLGLAPRVTAQIMGLLRDLRERMGVTVVLVEQNARSALSVADRAIVLQLGRVVASDETLDERLRHAYLGF
jgi:branched-chain amino acid transport system ATP-binding protein